MLVVHPPVAREQRGGGPRERFEDSNRWVRGRIVAALAAGESVPGDIDEVRVRRALDGLIADGLVVRDGSEYALPAG